MADLGTPKDGDLAGPIAGNQAVPAAPVAHQAVPAAPVVYQAVLAQPVVAQPMAQPVAQPMAQHVVQPMAQHVVQPGMQPGVQPGSIMMMTQAPQTPQTLTPELAAMAKDLKCCSIALLVFSILALTDLFVLIPGCITASQFVCEDVALWSTATLREKASCAKCGATTTIVLSAISLAFCMLWGLLWFVWGGWVLVVHGRGIVLPALILACLICCKAGRVVALAAANGAVTV